MSPLKKISLKSLRLQLTLWFGGLVLVAMVCVALYVGRIATSEILTTAGETLSISTRASAEMLASSLIEREREINLLKKSLEYRGDDLSGAQARTGLENIRDNNMGYAWIGIADISGQVVQATDGLLTGQFVGDRPWFRGAFDGLFVGDLHKAVLLAKLLPNQGTDEPVRFIDIAVPIHNPDGNMVGVLASHLHWTWVTDVVKSLLSDKKSLVAETEILIADRSGAIIYPEKYAGKLQVPNELDSALSYQVLPWQPDGEKFLTSVAAVGAATAIDLGWKVLMREPLDRATQGVAQLEMNLMLLGILAFLVFMVLAYRISRRLSQPIEDLAKVARQIESDPDHIRFPREGSPELVALSSAFESMTHTLLGREAELATLNASLESQVASRTEELRQANQQLSLLATTDALTGLLNRRSFEQSLNEHHQRFMRTGIPYCILMIDIDHFKSVNDTFGHQAGDTVLQQIARTIKDSTRSTDICARFGGEEFIVLVPDRVTPEEGHDLGQKICSLVSATAIAVVGSITISVGVSEAEPDDPSGEAVISRADRALYKAKAQGRNRVIQLQGD